MDVYFKSIDENSGDISHDMMKEVFADRDTLRITVNNEVLQSTNYNTKSFPESFNENPTYT